MKVLIVDDEELIRRSLLRVFQMHNHIVFEAADGQSGLHLWQKEQPDLVILDVLMPGLTGPKVLAEMKGKTTSKTIMISAYTGDYDLQKAQDMGASYFVSKPFHNIFDILKLAEELLPMSSL